jgi:hypothetical protein
VGIFFRPRLSASAVALYRRCRLPAGPGHPERRRFSELQAAFIRHIKAAELHYTPFSNRDQLRAEVLKEPWPEKLRAKPIVLPYASLGSLFKDRDDFLRRLRQSLARPDGRATAIVSKALYGMGGIGKTRTAVEYGWAYRAGYTALLFAQADSPEELRRNLAGLAGRCSCPKARRPRRRCGLTRYSRGWQLIQAGC